MKSFLIYLVAAIVLGGGYIYALKSFGQSRYDSGYDKCESDHNNSLVEKNDEQIRNDETIEKEIAAVPNDGLDDELRNLSILRDDADY